MRNIRISEGFTEPQRSSQCSSLCNRGASIIGDIVPSGSWLLALMISAWFGDVGGVMAAAAMAPT